MRLPYKKRLRLGPGRSKGRKSTRLLIFIGRGDGPGEGIGSCRGTWLSLPTGSPVLPSLILSSMQRADRRPSAGPFRRPERRPAPAPRRGARRVPAARRGGPARTRTAARGAGGERPAGVGGRGRAGRRGAPPRRCGRRGRRALGDRGGDGLVELLAHRIAQ